MKRRIRLFAATAIALAAATLPAQQSGGRADGLAVTLLGTAGGPPAHVDRSQPATLLRIAGHAYLVDAGENAGQQLLRAGLTANRVDATFLTHLHWDHTLGLGYVVATGWMLGRAAPMPIVGPPGTATYVGREIAALGIGEELFRAETPNKPPLATLYVAREQVVERPTLVYADQTVRVTAVPNSHFSALPPGQRHAQALSFAYRFDTARGSVAFTGDTGPSAAVTELARGADMLVSEICDVDSIRVAMAAAMPGANLDALVTHMRQEHLGPEEVGRMAAAAGVRRLVLTHYVMGPRYDPQAFVARIRPFYKGEIVVGQDLATIAVPPR